MATTYANVADLRTAEALSAEFLMLLADRGALMNHAALVYAGDAAGSGSATVKVPHIGLGGYDLLASVADGVAVSSSAITDGATTVSVGRYAKAYEPTDLARLTGGNGLLDPEMFAADAMASYAATLVSLIAAEVDTFATVKGASGAQLSVSTLLSAVTALEVAKVSSPFMAMLAPQQIGDLRDSLATSSAGAIQWNEGTQQQLVQMSGNYKGSFLGVDLFSSAHVTDDGTDKLGGVFGRGAVCFADATIPTDNDPQAINIGGKVLFERTRTAASGTTLYTTSAFLGVSEGIDLAGVTLRSRNA